LLLLLLPPPPPQYNLEDRNWRLVTKSTIAGRKVENAR
jgi:hypothetical protein